MDSEPQASKCFEKALQLLARRPHFRRELIAKLEARGFPPEVVGSTVEKLDRRQLLDDRANARQMATGSLSRKGFGPRRMQAELRRRGVEEEIAAEVVREVYPDSESEMVMARKFASNRARRGRVDKEALARSLDRRGYSKAVVFRILSELSDRQSDP